MASRRRSNAKPVEDEDEAALLAAAAAAGRGGGDAGHDAPASPLFVPVALTTASVVLVYFGYVYGLARGAEYVATLAVVGAAAAALLHAAYGAEGARAGGRRARAGAPAAELAPASLAAYAIGAVNFWFFAGAVGAGWAFRSFVPHAGALANDRVYGLSHGVVATLLPAVAAWASGKTRYF